MKDDHKATSVGVSLTPNELREVDERVAELKLGSRGRSKYFRMLRDLDKRMRFEKHYHHTDGDVHFYPEAGAYPMAAETPTAMFGSAADVVQRALESATPPAAPVHPQPHTTGQEPARTSPRK